MKYYIELWKYEYFLKKFRFMRRKSAKAQMELVGLSILAAIIMMAFMFFIIMSSKESNNGSYQLYKSLTTSSNFVTSLIQTNTDCNVNHPLISDLLIDCATNQHIDCGGINSCVFVTNTINKILKKTFDVMNLPYRFEIDKIDANNHVIGDKPIYFYSHRCNNPKSTEAIPFVLPLGESSDASLSIMLSLCKN